MSHISALQIRQSQTKQLYLKNNRIYEHLIQINVGMNCGEPNENLNFRTSLVPLPTTSGRRVVSVVTGTEEEARKIGGERSLGGLYNRENWP